MDTLTRRKVRERAADRCEYCGLHQDHSPLAPLQIEHIIPRKHGGTDDFQNLALACIDCNLGKGSNVAGCDPATSLITPLFHPRKDRWEDHFEIKAARIEGKTPVGRTTVMVLNMNSDDQLELRALLLARRKSSGLAQE
jgi:HNH endonuclease